VDATAAHGVTTGISAADRAATIRMLVSPEATAHDWVSPGHVFPLEAREGGVLVRAGHTEAAVDLDIAFQKKLGAILFGGEGLIIQKASGDGTIFINACGDLIDRTLGPGEMMRVSTAHAVGWEPSVAYDIAAVPGIKTALFGGEGLFVTTLRGPGRVILQSMTLQQLANALNPFLPKNEGGGIRIG